MFYQIFLSPQVKRWAIITYKHGTYQLPHELPKECLFAAEGALATQEKKRLTILENKEISGKCPNFIE